MDDNDAALRDAAVSFLKLFLGSLSTFLSTYFGMNGQLLESGAALFVLFVTGAWTIYDRWKKSRKSAVQLTDAVNTALTLPAGTEPVASAAEAKALVQQYQPTEGSKP